MDHFQKQGIVFDVQSFMQKMTLDVLGKTIFGHDFNAMQGFLQEELNNYNYVLRNMFPLRISEILFPMDRLPLKRYTELHYRIDKLNQFILGLIQKSKERIQNNKKATTLLDFLVKYNQEKNMTDEELRSNVVVFFLAGHETVNLHQLYSNHKRHLQHSHLPFTHSQGIQRFRTNSVLKLTKTLETLQSPTTAYNT